MKSLGLFIVLTAVCVVVVRSIDLMTNIVPEKLLFDSIYYIRLAENGFTPKSMVSPFVYRYATPWMAGALHALLEISLFKSFRLIAYFAGTAQLISVFGLVYWLTRSFRGSFAAVFAVAFSLFNLKYLLFDVYRPDHFAYAIIVLSTILAFQKRFAPLLLLTMLGAQIREFVVIPLIAYLIVHVQFEGIKPSYRQLFASVMGLVVSVVLPRVLIPITKDIQAVHFSLAGTAEAISMVIDPKRLVNIVFIVLAYLLPSVLLFRRDQSDQINSWLDSNKRAFVVYYSALAFLLLIVGGTDLDRFATYLFLPQVIFVGFRARSEGLLVILAVLAVQFAFNRIWLDFPTSELRQYIDFYGGYGSRVTPASLMRFAELASYIFGFKLLQVYVFKLGN